MPNGAWLPTEAGLRSCVPPGKKVKEDLDGSRSPPFTHFTPFTPSLGAEGSNKIPRLSPILDEVAIGNRLDKQLSKLTPKSHSKSGDTQLTTLKTCEDYAKRLQAREDLLCAKNDKKLEEQAKVQAAERQQNKAVSDAFMMRQMTLAQELHLATMNFSAQCNSRSLTPQSESVPVGPLSPDAIVQRVDSSLTIALLAMASSVCNEEMLEGVIERIEGLGNQMIVRLAASQRAQGPRASRERRIVPPRVPRSSWQRWFGVLT